MMKDFVLEFNTKLGYIREVLSETISEAWDSENDILTINMVRIHLCLSRRIFCDFAA